MRRTAQQVVVNTLLDRAGDVQALTEVRAACEAHLAALRSRVAGARGGSAADRALRAKTVRDIDRYFSGTDDPKTRSRYPVIVLPWP